MENNVAVNNGYSDPHCGSGCGFMVQNNLFKDIAFVTFKNNNATNSKKAGFCVNGVNHVELSGNSVYSSTTIDSTLCNTMTLVSNATSVLVYGPAPSSVAPYVYLINIVLNKVKSCL